MFTWELVTAVPDKGKGVRLAIHQQLPADFFFQYGLFCNPGTQSAQLSLKAKTYMEHSTGLLRFPVTLITKSCMWKGLLLRFSQPPDEG